MFSEQPSFTTNRIASTNAYRRLLLFSKNNLPKLPRVIPSHHHDVSNDSQTRDRPKHFPSHHHQTSRFQPGKCARRGRIVMTSMSRAHRQHALATLSSIPSSRSSPAVSTLTTPRCLHTLSMSVSLKTHASGPRCLSTPFALFRGSKWGVLSPNLVNSPACASAGSSAGSSTGSSAQGSDGFLWMGSLVRRRESRKSTFRSQKGVGL